MNELTMTTPKLTEKCLLEKALYLNEMTFTAFKTIANSYKNNEQRKKTMTGL
jgi:hypothetical protein